MRRFFNNLALACVAAAMLLGGVGQANANMIVGGNVPIERQIIDTYQNFSILDKNNAISATGTVTSWDIFAGATTPVELLIYRETSPNVYAVVGNSSLETTVNLGLNTFTHVHRGPGG